MFKVKREKLMKFLTIIIPALILCLLLLSMLYIFRDRVSRVLSLETEDKLMEVTSQMKHSFENEINGEWNTLQLLATMAEKESGSYTMLKSVMGSYPNDETVKRGIVDLTGKSIYGDPINMNDFKLFLASFRGDKQVLYLDHSGFFDEPSILLSVPLYNGRNISGAVYKVISGKKMENLFYRTIFDGKGFTYCSGTNFSQPIIPTEVNPQNAAIATELIQNEKNKIAIESLNRKMFYKRNAVEIFYHGDASYYIASSALEIMPGWYGMSVVGTEVVDEKVRFILMLSTACLFFLILLFLFLYLVLRASEFKNSQMLHRLAYYDELTGLLNFEGLRLYGQSHVDLPKALALLDIKGFRMINKSMGEVYGTGLLKNLADTLASCLDKTSGELACRVKDDVFAIWLTDTVGDKMAIESRLLEILGKCSMCSDKVLLKFFCGVYPMPSGCAPSLAAIDCCIFAKKQIRYGGSESKIAFYDAVMQARENEDKLLQDHLTKGLAAKEFLLYFQPKFSLQTGRLYGAEALVRWQHPEQGMISPGRFISLFEENGRIDELDMYMFKGACALIRKWLDSGKSVVPISVNISRSHLNDPNLSQELGQIVEKYQIPLEYIELELTESAFFEDFAKLIAVMGELKRQGFSISVDDFGTGYSSLSTLAEMPIDTIKLDKSFVDAWVENPETIVIIKGVLAIASNMKIETLAEGIETEEQKEMLKAVGCSIGQGFYYSKPLEVSVYEKLLREVEVE